MSEAKGNTWGTLAAGLGPAERDALADLLGSVVTDNEVPVVVMEPDESVRSSARP